jgi:hypothetical protein
MKQQFVLAGVLMLVGTFAAFAQNKIAILPFTGGQGNEGETVAELFSFDSQLSGRFGIIPRTSITRAVEQEHEFQKFSGMANADTIVELGRQMGAQYVMAGNITALGGQKLLVVTIIRIETVQQVAGDYLAYSTEGELAGKISAVVQNLVPMLDVDTSGLEKLAVLPIQLGEGASVGDADTLAQILSIELTRNKSYAIYPRTASLEQVQREFETQRSGVTDERQAAQLGRAENPRLVLSVVARKLGTLDMFNASIIDLEDGIQIKGTFEEYANMSDGITVMGIIAKGLSGRQVGAFAAFAQNKIAILPFTGGQGNEGETVAELFSFDSQLSGRFGIIPRTSITRAVEQEQNFQKFSGMANADTIVELGRQMGAQYVMAGNITALGGQKLLVVTIIRIETVQQVAGDYLAYSTEGELAGKISAVVQNLVPMLDVDTSGMEKLAVLPIQLGGGASARDADTLAQILSIELTRNKSYAIYPRTASLEQVQREFETQRSGVTDERQAVQLGRAENPRLVLSVAARKLGTLDMFNASIIDLEDGIQIKGTSEEYANMSDGITVMGIIANVLSGQEAEAERRRREAEAEAEAERRQREAEEQRREAEEQRRWEVIAAEEAKERRRREAAAAEAQRQREVAAEERRQRDAAAAEARRQREAAAKREEAVRKREEARARFIENVGWVIDVQGGIGYYNRDPDRDFERIFGEGSNTTDNSGINLDLDLLLGLRYSWFSINTGASIFSASILSTHNSRSRLHYSFVRVPVLLMGDWGVLVAEDGAGFYFNLSAGIGFNVPLKATVELATTTYNASLTMPPSLLFGVGLDLNPGDGDVIIYSDIQCVIDFAATEVKLDNGMTGSFTQPVGVEIGVGFKWRLPFAKKQ